MNIFQKLKKILSDMKKYWSLPPEGRYMTYKEIASLAGGSVGVRVIIYCVSQMIISVGNTLIGNTIGIAPTALYAIYIISLITAFPLTALRARMIDNTKSKQGKYRPYIISMGLPTAILGSLFVWMPYGSMSQFMKCAVVLLFNIGFQFFYNFYNECNDSIINVLSPNSIERSDVLSIKYIVENISPSIINIIFPLLAKLITGEDTLYDIRIYRYLFPPMLFAGFLLSLVVYVNTSEKTVRASSHFIEIKFIDALREVAKNKYFWIISLAGWIGFLEGAVSNIMQWMYNYQNACSAGQYTLIVAITGNASFWPNIVAPFFIRKYGKKKVLVFSNIFNIFLIFMMLPVVKATGTTAAIWLLTICVFLNNFATSLGHLLNPSINADIRDYQHYVSGERIDGMFAAVGLIGNVISMLTSSVLPTIYEKAGLNKATAISLGYDGNNVYDVLFDNGYFVSISTVLIFAAVIGATLNVIPYFFYDFTEVRQKGIIKVLKIRAILEDRANGTFSKESEKELYDIISESKNNSLNEFVDLENISKQMKKAKGEEYKKLKKDYKQGKKQNEEIEISRFVVSELEKFQTPAGKIQLEYAKAVNSLGLNGFTDAPLPDMKSVKQMPRETEDEKQIRNIYISLIREKNKAIKYRKKYNISNLEAFDTAEFSKIFALQDALEENISDKIKEIKEADKAKNKDLSIKCKSELKSLQQNRKDIKIQLKKATNDNTIYHRCAKPFIDSAVIIAQAKNYSSVGENR